MASRMSIQVAAGEIKTHIVELPADNINLWKCEWTCCVLDAALTIDFQVESRIRTWVPVEDVNSTGENATHWELVEELSRGRTFNGSFEATAEGAQVQFTFNNQFSWFQAKDIELFILTTSSFRVPRADSPPPEVPRQERISTKKPVECVNPCMIVPTIPALGPGVPEPFTKSIATQCSLIQAKETPSVSIAAGPSESRILDAFEALPFCHLSSVSRSLDTACCDKENTEAPNVSSVKS